MKKSSSPNKDTKTISNTKINSNNNNINKIESSIFNEKGHNKESKNSNFKEQKKNKKRPLT